MESKAAACNVLYEEVSYVYGGGDNMFLSNVHLANSTIVMTLESNPLIRIDSVSTPSSAMSKTLLTTSSPRAVDGTTTFFLEVGDSMLPL